MGLFQGSYKFCLLVTLCRNLQTSMDCLCSKLVQRMEQMWRKLSYQWQSRLDQENLHSSPAILSRTYKLECDCHKTCFCLFLSTTMGYFTINFLYYVDTVELKTLNDHYHVHEWSGWGSKCCIVGGATHKTGDCAEISRVCTVVMAVRLLLLRCWVGLVGAVAIFNALQCFMDADFAKRRIYTLEPQQGRMAAIKHYVISLHALACYSNSVRSIRLVLLPCSQPLVH